MVDAWNNNMRDIFAWMGAAWMIVKMEWTSQCSCLGFMFVPRQPHPFSNEWHSICCEISDIMYAIELVEGKNSPPQLRKSLVALVETVGGMLHMKKKLWNSCCY
jgi:Transposase IS4